MELSAFLTAVENDHALFSAEFHPHRLQIPSAFIGAIPGINIHVKGVQTKGTVIPGGIGQRPHLPTTVMADKTGIILDKGTGPTVHIFLLDDSAARKSRRRLKIHCGSPEQECRSAGRPKARTAATNA